MSALAALSVSAALPTVVGAAPAPASDQGSNPTTVAVIGDVPYGTEQEAAWGELIAAINDDPKVRLAAHVGDIKSGSTTCTDERFAAVASDFETFRDPVVYTPGDNEWTDCHRPNNGGYDPLERLDVIRSLFFSEPGTTLGRPMGVDAQAGYPENVRWVDSRVVFAAVHVVGSDNGMAPWTGNAEPTPEQEAEVEGRIDAALAWIDAAFDRAERSSAEGVVLLMQADTWRPSPTPAQQEVAGRIADRTAAFAGEVLVLQGDSHSYVADNPLSLDNFQRIVVHGEDLPFEYLRLTIDPMAAELFSWERVPVTEEPSSQTPGKPLDALVVGHRGASGYRPEHTLASYELAIEQCADYIEPDLVMTSDGVLVARHENEIGGTTDVESHAEFADRFTTKTIDGRAISGWFTEDFTLDELKTLRAEERIPATRPANTAYNGLYEVPTLEEVIQLAQSSRTCDGKRVGIYPETKHPSYFDSIGLSMEEPLVDLLNEYRYRGRGAPVIIQSFEVSNLQDLNAMTNVKLAQLINCSGAPYDFVASGDPRTYAELVTPAGLDFIAGYANGIGACKNVLIPRNADGTLGAPTAVIDDAHARGLIIHGWTFRAENQFLPAEYRSSTDPNGLGDMAGEVRAFVAAGMDGFFTDHPDLGAAAVR